MCVCMCVCVYACVCVCVCMPALILGCFLGLVKRCFGQGSSCEVFYCVSCVFLVALVYLAFCANRVTVTVMATERADRNFHQNKKWVAPFPRPQPNASCMRGTHPWRRLVRKAGGRPCRHCTGMPGCLRARSRELRLEREHNVEDMSEKYEIVICSLP
jgi:uncharacterized membrane protein